MAQVSVDGGGVDRGPRGSALIVVFLGGVIRSSDRILGSRYGQACRVDGSACAADGQQVALDVQGWAPQEQAVDALVMVDWRPARAAPLVATLAHEVGHGLGLGHHGDVTSECQLSMPVGSDATNLMAGPSHLEPDTSLDDLALDRRQAAWVRRSWGRGG